MLYLIEILHQTTTELSKFQCLSSCILSKFYIKPQHYPMLFVDMSRCILSKFYIKPQRRRWLSCCFSVVSYRNSTSNHNLRLPTSVLVMLYLIEILHQTTTPSRTIFASLGCILSKFYIKPQHDEVSKFPWPSCILSKFYIKPQQPKQSQHRTVSCILSKFYIKPQLYEKREHLDNRCILSKFYIKPQHGSVLYQEGGGCILSKFYIKPQRANVWLILCICCILSKFYIKPQLIGILVIELFRCILSKFYIKPQRHVGSSLHDEVVSYRNSTSNHNSSKSRWNFNRLYLIEILHQTTTFWFWEAHQLQLYLIEILHQTSTNWLLEDFPA